MSWGGCLVIAAGGFAVLVAAFALAVLDRPRPHARPRPPHRRRPSQ